MLKISHWRYYQSILNNASPACNVKTSAPYIHLTISWPYHWQPLCIYISVICYHFRIQYPTITWYLRYILKDKRAHDTQRYMNGNTNAFAINMKCSLITPRKTPSSGAKSFAFIDQHVLRLELFSANKLADAGFFFSVFTGACVSDCIYQCVPLGSIYKVSLSTVEALIQLLSRFITYDLHRWGLNYNFEYNSLKSTVFISAYMSRIFKYTSRYRITRKTTCRLVKKNIGKYFEWVGYRSISQTILCLHLSSAAEDDRTVLVEHIEQYMDQ